MCLADRLAAARRTLEATGQAHVLHFYDGLEPAGRQRMLSQIESVDWLETARLVKTHVKVKPKFELPSSVRPAPWYPFRPSDDLKPKYQEALALGGELIRQGKVAAFTVAGGQGTRLSWNGPKGSFPATPIRRLPLFGCLAEYILKIQDQYHTTVPWYVMTSPANDADIRAVFERHNYFGLDRCNVLCFPQAMMPAFDKVSGEALLAAPDGLALSPNGHGGSLKALCTSGAIDDMKSRGIEQISYTQVDNPLVRVVDPQFIGLHALDGAEMSSKMLPKAFPKEKLGNFCLVDGKVTVIEYTDLPEDLAEQRTDDGELRFRAGSVAIHVIRVDFVESLNRNQSKNGGGGFALPCHRAEKQVGHIDLDTGRCVEPERANAVKLEMFVFDALPMCTVSVVYETDRADEFAPIKNADAHPIEASVDSPATSRRMQIERAARWLAQQGVQVPRKPNGEVDAVIEISQRTAIVSEDLDAVDLPEAIAPGSEVSL